MYRLFAGLLVCCCLFAAESNRQQIIQALRNGNPREAEQLSAAELETAPSAVIWALNGMAHLQLHESEAALASFRSALKLDSNYLPALEGAAQVLYAQGSQDAAPLLKHIVNQRPNDLTSHAMLAALAYKRNDCAAAITDFSQAEALIASEPAALRQQGACYLRLKEPESAVQVFEKLLQLVPADPKSRYELAIAQLAANHPEQARTTLAPLTNGGKPNSQALNLTAQTYEVQGDTTNAVQVLRQAILANPDVVGNYLDFATLSLIHRSANVGIDVVSIGIKRLPAAAPLYLARGILYVELGQYDNGARDFETAEKLDPSGGEASVALGMESLQTSNLAKAETELRARIARQPGNAALYDLLGETLLRRGAAPGSAGFAEALRVTNKALSINPRLATARDLLGRLYLESGDIAKAIEQSRLAVKENPEDQSAVYHLILALRRSGDTADLPALTRRLAELRTSAMKREGEERRFSLVEEGK